MLQSNESFNTFLSRNKDTKYFYNTKLFINKFPIIINTRGRGGTRVEGNTKGIRRGYGADTSSSTCRVPGQATATR